MRLSLLLPYYIAYETLADPVPFKSCLIISHGYGSQDPAVSLPNSSTLFTTAAADTEASYFGLFTGLTTLAQPVNWNLPADNIFSIMPDNIATGFFGAWPLRTQINLTNFTNTQDPALAIASAVKFVNDNANKNFFCVVAVPRFALEYKVTSFVDNSLCREDTRSRNYGRVYKSCPDNIYQQARKNEILIMAPLLDKLKQKNAFVGWMSDHGPVSELDDSYSVAYSKYRGMQKSLYFGGIRSEFMWQNGILPQIKHSSFDARDLITSFAKVLGLGQKGAGINIFDANSQRLKPLEWMTPEAPNAKCLHASPKFAVKYENASACFFVYYDSKRQETYRCDNIAQYIQDDIPFLPALPQELNAGQYIDGCVFPATTHKINRARLNGKLITASNGLAQLKIPHQFFILLDDAGYKDLGFNSMRPPGQVSPDTPNIDSLLRRSIKFTNMFSNAVVCSPSRAASMTGKYTFNRDVAVHTAYEQGRTASSTQGNALYLGAANLSGSILPNILRRDLNYTTSHWGKWHLSGSTTGLSPCNKIYGLDAGKFYVDYKLSTCPSYNEKVPFFSETIEDNIVQDAIAQIRLKLAERKKVFASLWFKDPHAPTNLHESVLQSINKGSQNNPRKFDSPVTLTDARVPAQVFYAGLKVVDNAIGDFISFLEEQNILQDSVIYLASDNPPEASGINRFSVGNCASARCSKRSTYDLRTPGFMFIGNNIFGAQISGVTNVPSTMADILPTAYTFGGGSVQNLNDYRQLDGDNLLPCLINDDCSAIRERHLLFEARYQCLQATCYSDSPRFSVLHEFPDGFFGLYLDSVDKKPPARCSFSRKELYNITGDMLQANNLFNRPDMQSKITQMQNMLFAYPNYDTKYWPPKINPHIGNPNTRDMLYGKQCPVL